MTRPKNFLTPISCHSPNNCLHPWVFFQKILDQMGTTSKHENSKRTVLQVLRQYVIDQLNDQTTPLGSNKQGLGHRDQLRLPKN